MSGSTPKSTQAKPTKPRPRDAQGRELDQWGLPFCGPARQRRLAELNKPDPNVEPGAWASAGTVTASTATAAPGAETEKKNG